MDRLDLITPPNRAAMESARKRWNGVAKPLHSLGLLEDAVVKIAGMTGNAHVCIDKRCALVMCADNGVVEEGVTQTGSHVTAVVAKSMAEGTANINSMARVFGADVIPVDMGMKEDIRQENLLVRKTAFGTGNITKGPAMSTEQAGHAISAGIDLVRDCVKKNYRIIVTGEMGIGNTTTSSAIASVLLDLPPEKVTGKGAGLDSRGLVRKRKAIAQAIAVNRPDRTKPVELLAKLGGFDIAGMTGVFLGGAVYKVPVVIDGFISAVAAALAAAICPAAKEYMLCSHVSKEPAGSMMLEYMGLKPLICGELCLGEGTGAILLLPMLDGALSVYDSVHRFDALSIESYEELTC